MTCPGKQTFPRMTMGLGTPEQAMACQLLKSSCASYTQRAPARCKGPPDHLLTARYACFVPVIRKTQNNRDFTLSRFYVEPIISETTGPDNNGINKKEISDVSEISFFVGAEGFEPPTLCL